MTRQSQKEHERQKALDHIRPLVKPGDKVYTILRHVLRSGMSRAIGVVLMPRCDPEEVSNGPMDITPWVAKSEGMSLDRDRWGVKIGGCGMDMGFALVYDLSYHLFPAGFGCIGEGCPSNDHSNGDRDYTPHTEARPRTCPQCKGSGKQAWRSSMVQQDTCRTCGGTGALGETHWHNDGGYALRQSWL